MSRSLSSPTDDRKRLASDLAALGLRPDRDVLVHCSMSAIGPVDGGPATMLGAIQDVIGPAATVVVPTQTVNNSTTTAEFRARTRGYTAAKRAAAEDEIEAFDRYATPSYRMGALAEYVRTRPGAVRSEHPQTSFAAVGPSARSLMDIHDLDSHLGERSPLAGLYEREATILLLGVDYRSCTALHLAEYRVRNPAPRRPHRCFVQRGGRRQQLDFLAPHLDAGDFTALGEMLDQEPFVGSGTVGNAPSKVMPMRDAVTFAIGWMSTHRG